MNEEKQQAAVSEIVGGPMAPDPNSPVEVVDIQFRTGAKIYFFDPNGVQVASGDHVIIETTRGPEYGICTAGNHTVPFREIVPPLRKVLRVATENDEKTLLANRAKEKRAFEVCQQKIQEHGLDMQLVSAEYAFDGSKILFFFTSDDRVDFRELVKHLAGIFRTRIELRQIGVRDKAKMVGGLGICGRPFCCAEFLDDFQPVSIKMAKTQNLSLNPTKISGTCGRLMCCLKYEQDAYEDLLRTSPKPESFVDTPDGRGTVIEVNLLRQSVRVRMEEQPEVIGVYPNSEICVLRNGKAKKNNPPIPADLAPISGSGKRPRTAPSADEDSPMRLDPIRFRYRPDDIVEEETEEPQEDTESTLAVDIPEADTEPQEAPVAEAPRSVGKQPHDRRRNRGSRPKKPQQESEQSEPAEQKPEDKGEKPAPQRRRNYKPKQPKAPKAASQESDSTSQASAETSGGQPNRSRKNNYHHRKGSAYRPKKPNGGSAPSSGE